MSIVIQAISIIMDYYTRIGSGHGSSAEIRWRLIRLSDAKLSDVSTALLLW